MATFWLLNGSLGWRTGEKQHGVSAGDDGLRLTAAPGGPLSLLSPDGSLGTTLLPQGMAIDPRDGVLYMLQNRAPWQILRYYPPNADQEGGFVPLPGIGGLPDSGGPDSRQFSQPAQIAVAGGSLYVADPGSQRVQVFSLPELALLDLWRVSGWKPVDVVTRGGWVYVLDQANEAVFRARQEGGGLHYLCQRPAGTGQPARMAVDDAGRLYLVIRDGQDAWAEVYDVQGNLKEIIRDASGLRARFDPPAVVTTYTRVRGQPGLLRGYFRPPGSSAAFNRRGDQVQFEPADLLDVPPYRRSGTWVSQPLDSQIYQCAWHRVELELGPFPPGASLTISTSTSDDAAGAALRSPNAPFWNTAFRLAAPPEESTVDVMVQSPPGQFLSIKLDFAGDGFDSPVVSSLRLHYPRESYLDYLPAIFKSEETRSFLERFLAIFQTEWEALDARLDTLAALFDPRAVPAGPFLDQLAAWIGMPVEDSWSYEQKRNMLVSAARIYPHRGTPASLRAYLQAYLQNITGLTPEQQGRYPQLIEGFCERRHLELVERAAGAGDGETPVGGLGRTSPLWSPAVTGRLQVGVYAQVGEARLVSTGSPQFDLFHHYANRFRVYIPACWVRTRSDEDMIRRALEEEKPAQAAYELCLIEPRFIIGRQSTLGLDAILGDPPVARLLCPEQPPGPKRHRLGYGVVLAGKYTRVPRMPHSGEIILP